MRKENRETDLGYVHQVNGTEVLAFLRDAVESLVHLHTGGVPVVPEPDENNPVLLGEDGLVDLPAIRQMLEHETHGEITAGSL